MSTINNQKIIFLHCSFDLFNIYQHNLCTHFHQQECAGTLIPVAELCPYVRPGLRKDQVYTLFSTGAVSSLAETTPWCQRYNDNPPTLTPIWCQLMMTTSRAAIYQTIESKQMIQFFQFCLSFYPSHPLPSLEGGIPPLSSPSQFLPCY